MNAKNFFEQFNLSAQAKKYGISVWQYPQFLFLIMGLIIIASIIFSYILGTRYISDPFLVVLIEIILTVVLFIIDFIITRSFEKLIEVARMKTEFIEIASHQLRSPLTNLSWVTELLMSGEVGKIGEKQLEYLKILKDNSKKMIDLISNLLAVSEIEGKGNKIRKEKVFLPDLVQKIVSDFELSAKEKNILIKVETENNFPEISTSPPKIKLIIENLLVNAILYSQSQDENSADMASKEIKISIEKKKNNICFKIKDEGVGIPKEEQKYIFQKFFRSKNTMRYQSQGSGLGLYITKAIVSELGGKISFQSEENKGSTFWFTLPIKN